ncbi:hypothetical protein PENSUB_7280 [Penicillium subrubescens]|uniref:Uncharacterized protein n=1 Tax=Penicillium subrubescens TaxID=1316194 RepID=A0A1Q5TM39_9EURO|nr:hypothetical protein PENSUB_7280 [Penicillium subrubescens]
MSGLAGAHGEMLELERRVPSAFAGEGVVGFEGARSDLLPGSHHRRERVALVCWCGGVAVRKEITYLSSVSE